MGAGWRLWTNVTRIILKVFDNYFLLQSICLFTNYFKEDYWCSVGHRTRKMKRLLCLFLKFVKTTLCMYFCLLLNHGTSPFQCYYFLYPDPASGMWKYIFSHVRGLVNDPQCIQYLSIPLADTLATFTLAALERY